MLLTRSDGRRIRSLPPMQKIIPYIMRSRAASINLFQEHVDCTPLNNYICAHEVNGQRTMSTSICSSQPSSASSPSARSSTALSSIAGFMPERTSLSALSSTVRCASRTAAPPSSSPSTAPRVSPKLSRSSTMPSPEKPPPTIRRTAPINWPRPLCVFPAFSFDR